jgi:hypothetical protein
MTWGEFKKVVESIVVLDSSKIDYIDVDTCYSQNPKILVSQGREDNSIKITLDNAAIFSECKFHDSREFMIKQD